MAGFIPSDVVGFENYIQFTPVFCACVIGLCIMLWIISYLVDMNKNNRSDEIGQLRRPSEVRRDKLSEKIYALKIFGVGSVYVFLLTGSIVGWGIALVTIGTQIYLLHPFIEGSEVIHSSDISDLEYTWKCSRDVVECRNTADLDGNTRVVFSIFMAAFLSKDVIKGQDNYLLRQGKAFV